MPDQELVAGVPGLSRPLAESTRASGAKLHRHGGKGAGDQGNVPQTGR